MKYLVEIDLKSIKKNPEAGKTVTNVLGGKTVTFKLNKKHKILDDYTHFRLNIEYNDGRIEGEVITPEGRDMLFELAMSGELKGYNLNINEELHNISYRHAPEPVYLFKYSPTIIECCNCKKKLFHEQLDEQPTEDSYCDTICPNCGTWECCQLEYETIQEALKRKENG